MKSKLLHTANLIVLGFGIFMLIGLVTLAFIGRPPRSKMVGEKLPRMDLQPMLNVDQDFSNESLSGKVIVLHFWGTWCPPCMKEFPEFEKLCSEFMDNSSVRILSVSCSQGAELDLDGLQQKTERFMAKYETPIPTYSDGAAMSRQQLAMLSSNGSFGYPTTLLVGRDGKIVEAISGYYPGEMEGLVDLLRAEL
ncbi:MAG: TlpA disulfide reductase family protein [Planctomycetota bacterium]